MALGLERAGWRSLGLIEKNKDACATINENVERAHPLAKGWVMHEADVREVNYREIAGGSVVDLVAGGPPCQPFSLGGKHRAFRDDRDMFPQAIRAVRELRPKFFLFENVKGLLRKSFQEYFNYILDRLSLPERTQKVGETWQEHAERLISIKSATGNTDELAYRVDFQLFDAADYGVPQHRHRVIIIGVRSDIDLNWKFPRPTHSLDELLYEQYVAKSYWRKHGMDSDNIHVPSLTLLKKIKKLPVDKELFPTTIQAYKTVRDALCGLPSPDGESAASFFNHEFKEGAKPYPGHTGSYLDLPSKALKAGNHGVPGGENMIRFPDNTYRYYTTREAARVQGFPDNYVFCGSWSEAMRQIGNAVPVDLAYIIGKSLREAAEEHGYGKQRRQKTQTFQSARQA